MQLLSRTRDDEEGTGYRFSKEFCRSPEAVWGTVMQHNTPKYTRNHPPDLAISSIEACRNQNEPRDGWYKMSLLCGEQQRATALTQLLPNLDRSGGKAFSAITCPVLISLKTNKQTKLWLPMTSATASLSLKGSDRFHNIGVLQGGCVYSDLKS